MGFVTFCDNKGCRKEMEPVLDKKTDEVFCTECDQKINTLTYFAKRQMIDLGQIRKFEKVKKAWSVKCNSCEKENPPKLDKSGDNLICAFCDTELELSKPYAQVIKQNLQSQRRSGQNV